jgi:hypothetical protein
MKYSTLYKIVNNVDDLIFIGSTVSNLGKRMCDHLWRAKQGKQSKLYTHIQSLGAEHFKIVCIMTYADIDNETLKASEEKYIKHYDSINNGLNEGIRIGKFCSHKKRREICMLCKGSSLCIHQRRKLQCSICSPAVCENCKKSYAGKSNLTNLIIKRNAWYARLRLA